MKIYNKHHIEKLSMTDPIVRAHLDAQRFCQGITWEDMLHSLVISLVESKDAFQALALNYASRLPCNTEVTGRAPELSEGTRNSARSG